jgi:hypothetical protein
MARKHKIDARYYLLENEIPTAENNSGSSVMAITDQYAVNIP